MLLNSTGESIYGVNVEDNCTFANPASVRLLGYETHADLLGKNMHELVHHTLPSGETVGCVSVDAPWPESPKS